MNCKFCGCSEANPCHFSAMVEEVEHFYRCAWIVPGLPICTNPMCAEKAYAEARLVAERTMEISLRYYPEVAEVWLHR
jgi:hypothetical protein